MAVKSCGDCKKDFEYKKGGRYIRRYCDKCAAKRKKDYESIYKITASQCDD